MSPSSRHRRDTWISHMHFSACGVATLIMTHGLDILNRLAHSGDAIAVKKGRTSIDQPEPRRHRRQGLPIPGRGRTQAAWACVLVAATRSNLKPARVRMRQYRGAGTRVTRVHGEDRKAVAHLIARVLALALRGIGQEGRRRLDLDMQHGHAEERFRTGPRCQNDCSKRGHAGRGRGTQVGKKEEGDMMKEGQCQGLPESV
ncbi:hypothetical protein BC826DRAFT_587388 [Russula brevipes]|nr:hypothetical protein BC826DRAFT_587388 [Russula brevipes]